jgi:hypothetical protein
MASLAASAFSGCMQTGPLTTDLDAPRYRSYFPPVNRFTPHRIPDVSTVTPPASAPKPPVNPWATTVAARDWQYVVVHHTATNSGSVDSIHESHLKNKDRNGNPWLGIGYHFVIGNGNGMPDGEIEPTFRWRQQLHGAHAGSIDPVYNQKGIGVCLVGDFDNYPPTAAQRAAVKRLVTTLRDAYAISSDRVLGHKDVRSASTACPGRLFNVAELAAETKPFPIVRLPSQTWLPSSAAASGSTIR